jgi:hypothetical protein
VFTDHFGIYLAEKVNTQTKCSSTRPHVSPLGIMGLYQTAGDLDDVRTSLKKAQRAATLIYAHFKKEFGGSARNN